MAALPSASGPLEGVCDPFGALSRVAGAVGVRECPTGCWRGRPETRRQPGRAGGRTGQRSAVAAVLAGVNR